MLILKYAQSRRNVDLSHNQLNCRHHQDKACRDKSAQCIEQSSLTLAHPVRRSAATAIGHLLRACPLHKNLAPISATRSLKARIYFADRFLRCCAGLCCARQNAVVGIRRSRSHCNISFFSLQSRISTTISKRSNDTKMSSPKNNAHDATRHSLPVSHGI